MNPEFPPFPFPNRTASENWTEPEPATGAVQSAPHERLASELWVNSFPICWTFVPKLLQLPILVEPPELVDFRLNPPLPEIHIPPLSHVIEYVVPPT